ncbi:MAG: discoidin domain-containing protein [Chitinophagales bacterium]
MTHKILLFVFVLLSFPSFSFAQCDPVLIPFEEYALRSVSSEDGTNVAANALDGNVETLFRTSGNTPFPHELQIDLGSVRALTQLILTPPPSNVNGKLAEYEVYVSVDGEDWGEAQAAGLLVYDGFGDTADQIIDFGAVDGRYVRLVGLSNYDVSNVHRWLLAELSIAENPCGSSEKRNQTIDFEVIEKKQTTGQ